jgi:hypothetical protein
MHQWNFSSVARGDSEWVLAVCGRCGLMRTQNAPAPAHERHIDLRGVCPGEPVGPEGREVDKQTAGTEHQTLVAAPDAAARAGRQPGHERRRPAGRGLG